MAQADGAATKTATKVLTGDDEDVQHSLRRNGTIPTGAVYAPHTQSQTPEEIYEAARVEAEETAKRVKANAEVDKKLNAAAQG